MSLWQLSARELLARTASGAPTPGGGSVSAITGALGFGLVLMALQVSARHRRASAALPDLLERGQPLLDRLRAHPDADVAAFETYMAALALPKDSETQRAERATAVRAAARAASEAPLAAARDLLGALILAREAEAAVQRQVVSDVGAGAELLLAALRATLLNVDVNTRALSETEATGLLAARADLQRRAEAVHGEIVRAVREALAR